MNRAERQKRICEFLNLREECSVEEIARKLRVSGMTVRRELQALTDQGKVIRTHGGATMAQRINFEFAFLKRVKENEAAKQAIGREAAALIGSGQSVVLDSGTTTLAVAQHLRGRQNVRLITTSLPIASLLQYETSIEVLLLGGYLRAGSPDLAGALTEANLESLRADLAFIGSDGVDQRGAAYNESPEVARMLGKMVAAAKRAYLVADSSKVGQTALWRFCQVQDLSGLITDSGVDRSLVAALTKAGVNVIIAPRK